MRRPLCLILVAVALALAASPAGNALAASATWQSVDVTVHTEQTGGVVLVSGELPVGAPLPAQAELSVPAGSEIQWIGEILGGDTSADPALKYTKTTAKGADVYRFTLTKSRQAQIEMTTADAQAFDGSRYTSVLKWPATQNVGEVRLSVRVPQGVQIVQRAPGASLLPGEAGYSYYSKTVKNVESGDQLDLTFAYSAPAASTGALPGADPSSSSPLVQVVVLLLVGAGIVVLVMAVRRKMAAISSADRATPTETESTDRQDEEPSERGTPAAHGGKPSTAAKRGLIAAGIIGVIIVVAVIVGRETTKPQVAGDTVTKVFAPGQPCVSATIALTVPSGADIAATAQQIFAALKPVAGMNTATYNARTSSVDVGFCESSTSESAVREALAKTGLVAQGGAGK